MTGVVVVGYEGGSREQLRACLERCVEAAPDSPLFLAWNGPDAALGAIVDGLPGVASGSIGDGLPGAASGPIGDGLPGAATGPIGDGRPGAASGPIADGRAGVVALPQGGNRGFTAGANAGLRAALDAGCGHILLLNPDVALTAGTVERLAAFLAAHPGAAAAQPAVMLPDGRVNSLGNSWQYAGFGFAGGNGLDPESARRRLFWLRDRPEPAEAIEVPTWSGAAVMLSAEALGQTGLLSEPLFLYQEDLDLSLRQRLAGLSIWLLPEIRVTHDYDFSRHPDKWYWLERNRLWVLLSAYRARTLLLLSPLLLAAEVATLLQALAGGWLPQKLRAYGWWLRPSTWAALGEARRRVRRAITDRELLRWASPTVDAGAGPPGPLWRAANRLSAAGWRLAYPLIRW